MRQNILKTWGLLLSAFVLGAGLTACDSDTTTDEDGNTVNKLDKFFSTNVTRCERVGSVLQVEFTLKSLKENYTKMELRCDKAFYTGGNATDDLGNLYDYELSKDDSPFSGEQTFRIVKDEEVKLVAKLYKFDDTNKAKTVNIGFPFTADNDKFDSDMILLKNLSITDNRVLYGGIQTCDTGLSFELDSCRLGAGNVVRGSFRVKNVSGQRISELWLHRYSILTDGVTSQCVDNKGKVYNDYALSADNAEFGEDLVFSLNSGQEQLCFFRVTGADPYATWMTMTFKTQAADYNLSDSDVRFIEIPIGK